MRRFGISVYPNRGSMDKNMEYIKLAAGYGASRIFTCLISEEGRSVEDVVADFKKMTDFAGKLGMEVIADVDPSIFNKFGASYSDLSFFKEIGLNGIRLDTGWSGMEESIMTFNKYGIKIELNMSGGTKYLDNIMSYRPNVENIMGCHNFYPLPYTGLGLDHFIKCSKQFKAMGVRTAAFINSREACFGPWPVNEGLCTLEMHRKLPVDTQAKHLFATGLIDDVIIANAYASEYELRKLSSLDKYILRFKVEFAEGVTELDRRIVLNESHFNRGDVSEYVVRSTQSRVKYKGHDFPVYNTPDIKRGDILIISSKYPRYAGEVQIALKDMKNNGSINVAGRIANEEVFLLDYLKPWDKFGFVERDD